MNYRRLQACVEPYSHCDTIEGASGSLSLASSATDVNPGPPVQKVAPTLRRNDLGSSAKSLSPVFTRANKLTTYSESSTIAAVYPVSILSQNREDALDKNKSNPKKPATPPLSGDLHFPDNEEVFGGQLLSSTPLPKERAGCVDSHTEYNSEKLNELSMRCSELESKLKMQMDVNKELKRLLVASIGSDLQYRLNQIAEEKATISHDLDISLQQLAENDEELDRVSIQCDIWRSKFLASRLMIDELAEWKAEISQQLKESQRALQCMLKEHVDLSRLLVQSNHFLNEIGMYFSRGEGEDQLGGMLCGISCILYI